VIAQKPAIIKEEEDLQLSELQSPAKEPKPEGLLDLQALLDKCAAARQQHEDFSNTVYQAPFMSQAFFNQPKVSSKDSEEYGSFFQSSILQTEPDHFISKKPSVPMPRSLSGKSYMQIH
jgi:hypothetical protein